MYKIQTYNKISPKGLDKFNTDKYSISEDVKAPDAVVLRSFKMPDVVLPDTLKAIGRAGAGVNNVPVEKCTDKGIVVFNAPGANANAVKELVIAGMFLACRDIVGGINYAQGLKGKGDEVSTLVEKNKSNFAGFEVQGKTLGVIGLGAIGMMVANAALALGMDVQGYDPFLSVHRAWELSNQVRPAPSLEKMLQTSDFVSIHVPFTEETKEFFTKEKFNDMKDGAVLLNFSRTGLVNADALLEALEAGKIAKYVTDFPNDKVLGHSNIIPIPHLGASTEEAEENCAIMIADQVIDFLENGNITNSVNFPTCKLERNGGKRLIIANKNVPKIISQITTIMAAKGLNIAEMVNKSKGDLAYNIVDFEGKLPEDLVDEIEKIDGIIMTRVLD